MRVMLDSNVLVSAGVLSSAYLLKMVDELAEHHTIVLSTYVIDELKRVAQTKFPGKESVVEHFLRELPYELTYTPDGINPSDYPDIRDKKDLPVLASAIIEDVDILLTNDDDFTPIDVERPEVLTPHEFVDKYCL